MALDLSAVRLALRTHLLTTVGGLPALREWENRTFVAPSPNGENWVREFNSIVSEVVVATNTLRHIGNYRVQLVYPLGSGTEAIEGLSGEIAAAFHPGLSLIASPTCPVQVFRSERSSLTSSSVQSWYALTVTVSWIAHTSTV
jgi:hypothetical protein